MSKDVSQKRHYTQRQKAGTLRVINSWIEQAGGIDKIDHSKLIRKCIVVLGCSRKKAVEYVADLTPE